VVVKPGGDNGLRPLSRLRRQACVDPDAMLANARFMRAALAVNKGTAMAQNDEAAKTGNGNSKQSSLNVLAQYVKDLSFESPGAPNSLRGREQAPGININVNVSANPLSEKEFDVNLTLNAKASFDKEVLFNVELIYGGVFRVDGFPQEHMLPILFIECPRLLFPFARQIIAEATRNGGFPPLMLDPIDFAQMFQQKLAEDQAKAKVQVS
jgi:preprotein translocase subunit SecB